ncbi:MAG: NAD+ synthase [Candidatus Krumholzibacteria bacterium]|nr:NAD+ synthase [Candidatus Krumholzibacteria bacterium]
MKTALVQINTVVGDVEGNLQRIRRGLRAAGDAGVELIVFHELCICGYPPKDLVERPAFVDACAAALEELAAETRALGGVGVVVGLPVPSRRARKGVANAAALLAGGEVVHVQEKSLLPTYDVFDEARYFDPATSVEPARFRGEVLGISICEDAWNDPEIFGRRTYDADPIASLAAAGATLMINVSASPFTVGKERTRLDLVRGHARRHGVPFLMVNEVGGNDELVFDGRSLAAGRRGEVIAVGPMFEEGMVVVDTSAPSNAAEYESMDETTSIYRALVLGTHDYLSKCGFDRAVVGLSGGIDSAVTLAVAAEALGASQVLAVAMPSPHSSAESLEDARALAGNLGVELAVVPIGEIMSAYAAALSGPFAGRASDVAEENVQARIRGNILMAYSNKLGHLVLSTGNKSELAVGYCTLYGDMSGGLAVISDVPKTAVYRLAGLVNSSGEVIPRAIVEKAPSAELKPGQKDSDTLPPYEVLDAILDLYIEQGLDAKAIVERGFDRATVDWVVAAVRRSEYKRRQAPPGLKVTSKAFGAGRRFPIAARYDA